MSGASGPIALEELGLGSVLSRQPLQVPPNQREYAWTEREVTELLQDFASAVDEDGPYFLGTVVTIPREAHLELVDGQQRLATAAILLAAIRNYMREIGEDVLADSITHDFLSKVDRKARERVPTLVLNVDDNHLFKWIITSHPGDTAPQPTRESHVRLQHARTLAAKQVRNIVSTLDPKDHGDALNRWVSFIEGACRGHPPARP
jgi:Protein of unknown function DUF262